MKRLLVVFAKEPRPNEVKTRLAGALSPRDIARLYRAFIEDTIELSRMAECEERAIAYASSGDTTFFERYADGFDIYKQEGRDLGERMHNSFVHGFSRGIDVLIIVGSDTPNLPPSYIDRAFENLVCSDIVLGPSDDGGYYLIGLKSPRGEIFEGVKWSSGKVLSDTLSRAKCLKMKVAILDRWYDVDTPESLSRLKRELLARDTGRASKTKRVLYEIYG